MNLPLWMLVCVLAGTARVPPEMRPVRGPAWMEQAAVYYNAFEGKTPLDADRCAAGMTGAETEGLEMVPGGLFGRALRTAEKPFSLQSDAFSPHRPWTLSFWWALPKDMPIDGAFGLFTLRGRGIVSAFTRGRGEWCALQRPAGVLQVYYFPGIQNVNGIYDFDLASCLDLRAGAWHHTAVVFRRASTVQLYTDGRPVCEITASGREFVPADVLRALDLGGGVLLDEVAVLDRAVEAEMIADYFRGVSRQREYWAR